jgi:penicillin-binding protein 2
MNLSPRNDERPPISPQLALRVALLGVVALALFAIIFFRLWYLQVLSGDQYLRQANDNRVRTERVQAPRGAIVDRRGRALVENEAATVVTLDPNVVPEEDRSAMSAYGQRAGQRAARPKGERGPPVPLPAPSPELRELEDRLAEVLGTSAKALHERIVASIVQTPYAKVRVKTAVPDSVRDFILERKRRFRGVDVERKYLRRYPQGTLAAQIFGTTGEVSPRQLKQDRFKGADQGTVVGQDGLEYQYDRFLRGVDGTRKIIVDALGRPKATQDGRDPVAGRQLRLSLDARLQQTAQEALRRWIGRSGGAAGSFVAMDPRDGSILAMGSDPTFDPRQLQRPMTQEQYEARFGEEAGSPLFNRAVLGLYATGSTYKPFTAIAAMQSGVATPETTIGDPSGCITFTSDGQEFCNAGKEALGTRDMRSALAVSSDVYFYTLGYRMHSAGKEPLQSWSHRFGFAQPTGIDLPGDQDGTVPDRAWRKRINDAEAKCRKEKGIPVGMNYNVYAAARRGCGISDMREFSPGDNIQLAIGQGDLQASPLQLARAYAALANGGKLVQPHLALAVEDANGSELQRIEPEAPKPVKMDPAALQAVRDGLRAAAGAEGGTSAAVFAGWPQDRLPIFGKTGTAERLNERDHSWYAAWVPHPDKPIVVVVNVEKGGFGAEAAAPVAREILARWFNVRATEATPEEQVAAQQAAAEANPR